MVQVWILSNAQNKTLGSYTTAFRLLDQLKASLGDDVAVVYEEDLVQKMSHGGGLELYRGKERLEVPRIVVSRIPADIMEVNFGLTLLLLLERMGAIVVNSSWSVMYSINKALHMQELTRHGIPVPTTMTYSRRDLENLDLSTIHDEIGYPMVIKAVKGHGGSQVFMVTSSLALEELKGVLRHDTPYLFQEYIRESHGRDLRVIIIGGEAVYSIARSSNTDSMRANLSQGGAGEVVTGMFPDAEALAVRITTILRMDAAGVDLLYSDLHGYVCCEVNNNFGFAKSIFDGTVVTKYAAMIVRKLHEVLANDSPVESAAALAREQEIAGAI